MSAVDLMNQTCSLVSVSWSRSSTSSFMVPTYSSAATSVPCSIQPASGYQAQMGDKETGITEFDCYFPPDTTIEVEYRITTIAGGEGYADAWSGKTLEIRSFKADATGRGEYITARARLVEDGPTT
jgi:hypothetical protein